MKVIINTPYIGIPAGVANHYLGLRLYFSDDIIYNQFITSSNIKQGFHKKVKLKLVLLRIYDILKFVIYLIIYQKPNVLLNPSFGKNALKRDLIYLKIAKIFNCKVAVFFHGWDKEYLKHFLDGNKKFNPIWYKVDAYFVLAKEFKQYLLELKVSSPIYLTSTKVNDKLLENTPLETYNEEIKNILFLARIEESKGVFITIDTFSILQKEFPKISLRVVGRGSDESKARAYVKENKISNITFTGALTGINLINEYVKADIYILPTCHGEGMPTSILEAMAFGLPIISRPVGGLNDFFENDKMGYLIESLNPEDYAKKIEELINNIEKTNKISLYNKKYASEHFMASKVAPFLENILKNL